MKMTLMFITCPSHEYDQDVHSLIHFHLIEATPKVTNLTYNYYYYEDH